MKKIIYSLLVLSAAVLTACSDDKLNDVTPTATGTVTDNEGNVYNWVQIGNQQWTTSNARNGESFIDMTYTVSWSTKIYKLFSASEREELEENYMPVYGNLMTIEEALESAPEGWRLPTDEDWARLEAAYGVKNADENGMRAPGITDKLTNPDGIALTLGGAILQFKINNWYEYNFVRRSAIGYYWSSSLDTNREDKENDYYYYRRIDTFTGSIDRESTVSNTRFSVRWVRDVK